MADKKEKDLVEELMEDAESSDTSGSSGNMYKPAEAVRSEKKKSKALPITLGVVGGLAVIAAVIYFFFPGLIPFPSGDNSNKAYVMSVRDLSSSVVRGAGTNRYSGVVEPQQTRDVNIDSGKELGEIFVSVGDVVNAGDQLFSYDVDSMRMSLSQLNLDVERFNSQISEARAQITQYEADKAADPGQTRQYDLMIQSLRNDIQSYNYEIKKKQLEIDSMKAAIENSIVKSPITGTVKTVNDPNNPNQGSDSTAFIQIMSAGDFLIKATVNEMNISSLYVGMPVTIRSRVDESITWTGTVNKIDTSAPVQDNQGGYYYGGESDSMASSSKYYFYVSPDSSNGIILGQHLTVEPATETPSSVRGFLLGSYFICDTDTSHPYVWADVNGKLRKVEVKLGVYNDSTDEYDVVSGITMDDFIAFPDPSLQEGMKTTTEYVEPSYEDVDYGEGENYEVFVEEDGKAGGIVYDNGPMVEEPVEITQEVPEG